MTGYLIIAAAIAIALLIFWLRQAIKKTVVYPVDMRTKKVKDALLSEKPRWKVIKEENGLAIGFWLAVALIVGLWCAFGRGN